MDDNWINNWINNWMVTEEIGSNHVTTQYQENNRYMSSYLSTYMHDISSQNDDWDAPSIV